MAQKKLASKARRQTSKPVAPVTGMPAPRVTHTETESYVRLPVPERRHQWVVALMSDADAATFSTYDSFTYGQKEFLRVLVQWMSEQTAGDIPFVNLAVAARRRAVSLAGVRATFENVR